MCINKYIYIYIHTYNDNHNNSDSAFRYRTRSRSCARASSCYLTCSRNANDSRSGARLIGCLRCIRDGGKASFVGWSNDNFNNLHFRCSRETK